VVLSNTVLDKGRFGELDWGSKPLVNICIANCGQTITDSGTVTMDSL